MNYMKSTEMYRMDAQVKALKFLMDTNNTHLQTQRSNIARLNAVNDFSQFGIDHLVDQIVTPLKEPLGKLKIEIETRINFIPIYKDYLKDINGLSVFDSGDLIVLVSDINRFQSKKQFLAYCGFSPVAVCGDRVYKMKEGYDYSRCSIIGDEKSRIPNVSYNERLKKHIVKIIDKLIKKNDDYQDIYNDIWAKERMKSPTLTKNHITYRTKRKLAQKFIKDLYRNWKILDKELKKLDGE